MRHVDQYTKYLWNVFVFPPLREMLFVGSEMKCSLSKELCEVDCAAWFLYKSATANGCPLCWCVYFCSSIAVLFQGRGQQVMRDYWQSIDEICTILFAAAKHIWTSSMLQRYLLTNSHYEISIISWKMVPPYLLYTMTCIICIHEIHCLLWKMYWYKSFNLWHAKLVQKNGTQCA